MRGRGAATDGPGFALTPGMSRHRHAFLSSFAIHSVAASLPYNVVIGVAGANGTKVGGFTVKVELKPRT